MSTAVQRRRGTTAQHASFAGLNGELTVDTDKEVVVVHDGTTAGGYPQMRENGSQNLVTTGSITGGRFIPTSSTVPTNGLYLPSANSVALSTNGTGRLFIDDQGRVGVGVTAVAGVNFNVQGSSPVFRVTGASATNPTFQLSAAGVTSWSQVVDASNSSFYISKDGTERLRITSVGFVGVGTSSPDSVFHCVGAAVTEGDAAGQVIIRSSAAFNATPRAGIIFQILQDSSNTPAYVASIHAVKENATDGNRRTALVFGTRSSGGTTAERMRIDSDGRLGIGTTSVEALLDLVSSSDASIRLTRTAAANAKITTTSNGALAFSLDASGGNTERFRCDSSGRLLVGTSSSSDNARLVLQGYQGNATGASILVMKRGSAASTLDSGGYDIALLDFMSSDSGLGARISAVTDGVWSSTSDCPTRLVFSTTADGGSSPTERMRITNGGLLLVNATSSALGTSHQIDAISTGSGSNALVARHLATGDNVRGLIVSAPNCTTDGGYLIIGSRSTGDRFYVLTSGNVQNTNNSYGAVSDEKLKQDIEPAGSQWNDLKSLQVKKFRFKSEPESPLLIGLVAQEVEQVCPGLVESTADKDEDGNDLGTATKAVKYSVLYMKAVKALQEAMERIEQLETKVAALESA